MNNPDEQVHQRSSSLATVIYYVVGSIISAAIIFAGMQIFHDYFYGEGINKLPFRYSCYSDLWRQDFSAQN